MTFLSVLNLNGKSHVISTKLMQAHRHIRAISSGNLKQSNTFSHIIELIEQISYLCNGMDWTTTTSAPKLLSSVWIWMRDFLNERDDLLLV